MNIILENIVRTDAANNDFIKLVSELDTELVRRYGDEQLFFNQFNKTSTLRYAVVAYRNGIPAGCGAMREYDNVSMEMKRMFVRDQFRDAGIASKILQELEKWASELDFATSILETGVLQPEAVRLYTKNGYEIIPNYGQYAMVKRSICMKKHLK